MELTILTPTYNREKCLLQLYDSLAKQTNKSFVWLIVDDGSTDNTRQEIDEIKRHSDFQIVYLYKENGGKHTALNMGIQKVTTSLTFIVDSDDSLTPDAVDTIYTFFNRYKYEKGLCGFSYLRLYKDGRINGKEFVNNESISTYLERRINNDDRESDKAEVYFTSCLKEFPFPVFPGEKFLGEDIVWVRMGRKYKMVYINKGIYIGDYIDGGLTKTRRIHNIESPVGCMERAKEFMLTDIKLKYRFKAALQYIIYGKFAGISDMSLFKESPNRPLTALSVVPGKIIYYKWQHDYKKVIDRKQNG